MPILELRGKLCQHLVPVQAGAGAALAFEMRDIGRQEARLVKHPISSRRAFIMRSPWLNSPGRTA